MRRLSTALVALACLLPLLPPPLAAKESKESDDLRNWMDGPVRYIAAKEEMEAFRNLPTDSARALYIERFWGRRDPTENTLVNEQRQLFWERVQQANTNFIDSTKPGWMTDRGKIHILYGPPTEIQEDSQLQTSGLPAAGRGIIRWIYEGRPSARMDLDPIVVVPFVRDSSGEYRVSYDPKLASVFFDARAIREKQDESLERFIEMVGAPRATSLSVMLDLGRMQEVPPQEQILLERVETTEAYSTHPVLVRVDRYLHPERGQTLAVVTVDLSDAGEGQTPTIIARFTPLEATHKPRLLGEESFRVDQREGYRVAQARLVLEPGEYVLTVVVADAVKVRTGMHRSQVRIDPPSERLRFSDLVWAATLDSLSFASLASYDEPYHIGPFRVVPKLDSRYRPGQTVKLFFEVYGGAFPLRVSYQLQGEERDGEWVNLGRPSAGEQAAPSLGWELPTATRWPAGRYRIQVEITDAEERLITRQAVFTLDEAASP